MFGPAQYVSACESSSTVLVSSPACTEKILTDIRLGLKILVKVEAEIILVLLNEDLSFILSELSLQPRHFLAFLWAFLPNSVPAFGGVT
jgi:hypothetical protein